MLLRFVESDFCNSLRYDFPTLERLARLLFHSIKQLVRLLAQQFVLTAGVRQDETDQRTKGSEAKAHRQWHFLDCVTEFLRARLVAGLQAAAHRMALLLAAVIEIARLV